MRMKRLAACGECLREIEGLAEKRWFALDGVRKRTG